MKGRSRAATPHRRLGEQQHGGAAHKTECDPPSRKRFGGAGPPPRKRRADVLPSSRGAAHIRDGMPRPSSRSSTSSTTSLGEISSRHQRLAWHCRS